MGLGSYPGPWVPYISVGEERELLVGHLMSSSDTFTKGSACRIKDTTAVASRFPDLVGKLGYVEEVSVVFECRV